MQGVAGRGVAGSSHAATGTRAGPRQGRAYGWTDNSQNSSSLFSRGKLSPCYLWQQSRRHSAVLQAAAGQPAAAGSDGPNKAGNRRARQRAAKANLNEAGRDWRQWHGHTGSRTEHQGGRKWARAPPPTVVRPSLRTRYTAIRASLSARQTDCGASGRETTPRHTRPRGRGWGGAVTTVVTFAIATHP